MLIKKYFIRLKWTHFLSFLLVTEQVKKTSGPYRFHHYHHQIIQNTFRIWFTQSYSMSVDRKSDVDQSYCKSNSGMHVQYYVVSFDESAMLHYILRRTALKGELQFERKTIVRVCSNFVLSEQNKNSSNICSQWMKNQWLFDNVAWLYYVTMSVEHSCDMNGPIMWLVMTWSQSIGSEEGISRADILFVDELFE